MNKDIIEDLRKTFEEAAGHRKPEPERRYHKHDEYITYGISASVFDGILKNFQHRFLEITLKERLDLAEKLCAENIGELGYAGLYIVFESVKELDPSHFPVFDRIAENFHSWSHVDALSLYVFQPLMQNYKKDILKLVRTWSKSPVRWKRRASIVVFTRKAAKTGEFTDIVMELSSYLAFDREDIVQKGTGWALKDNLRSAPEKIIPFVKELRQKGAPSTVILYAIRDLKGKERKDILDVRKTT
ncbi:MAG: DNA alkylation repair protein [bacterium]|nr:DNA alkylation repair protein [bacterium]